MTLLLHVLAACVAASAISILLASVVSIGRLSKAVDQMVSFSAGLLLGTALLHLLPESLHQPGSKPHDMTFTLLAGLLGFFLLERLQLLRHDHHHEMDGHHHPHGHDAQAAGRGGMNLLVGSGIHALADGVLIAAAFQVDAYLGLMTAVAIATHEVPQQIGNFIVLLNSGFSRGRALLALLLAGLGSAAGGVAGIYFLGESATALPYVLVVAASSFIYIALSDLIPQLHAEAEHQHAHGHTHATWRQPLIMVVGVAVAWLASTGLHGH